MVPKILYEDKDVKVTENGVEIKWYFFPTAQSKFVPFSEILKVQYSALGFMSGQGRLWGMSVGRWGYWFAGDKDRFSRDHCIALHTKSWVKKAFTTAKPQMVYDIIYKAWREYQENIQKELKQQKQKQQENETNLAHKHESDPFIKIS